MQDAKGYGAGKRIAGSTSSIHSGAYNRYSGKNQIFPRAVSIYCQEVKEKQFSENAIFYVKRLWKTVCEIKVLSMQ